MAVNKGKKSVKHARQETPFCKEQKFITRGARQETPFCKERNGAIITREANAQGGFLAGNGVAAVFVKLS